MTSVSLTISVVLYKTPTEHLEKLFSSLILFPNDLFIFIIDNSPDNYLEKYCSKIPNCHYRNIPANPGFGAGHNTAILLAQELNCDYHLVLNADIWFDTDIISPLLDYLKKNDDVGLLMPKVLNSDGSLQYLCKLLPTPLDLFFRWFAPKIYKDIRNEYFELRQTGYDKIMFVPFLSGCFMLLRQSALKNVGLFDERFFMYAEDIDLSRRIAKYYRTLFFPGVTIFHEHGAHSHKSIKMFFVHLFSIIKYFNKWGWFFDNDRTRLNSKALKQLKNI